jgi:hypothetical protein
MHTKNIGGKVYVCREKTHQRTWWLVKFSSANFGCINLEALYLPKEFIGKKVRLVVEEVKEDDTDAI